MATRTSATRILIDGTTVPEPNWCWRPEWYSGSDSIYGLLAKFGSLNVLSTRELCELFITRNSPDRIDGRPGKPDFPIVDLRYVKNFRISRMANLLRLDTERVRMGFVEVLFPNATSAASPELVWCPICAKHGFHSPTFQLNFSNACPLHGCTLLRRCTRCASPIPYRLSATVRFSLFECHKCGRDFALALRSPTRALEKGGRATSLFTDYSDLVRYCDQLPTLINACKALVGKPYMPLFISKPDIYRRSASFRQFVADVLTYVSLPTHCNSQLSLEPMKPNFTYIGQCASEADTARYSAKHTSKSVSAQTDQKLEDAWIIYRGVRRHLWRHHLCEHRACARLAMKTLWWDLEGSKTNTFCSIALAFIRWRMQWEGRRIPSTLAMPNRGGVLYGLLGWISKDAPISSTYWYPEFEAWLNAHLLASACLDSFLGWQSLSAKDEANNQLRWVMSDHETFPKRHWACSGRGTVVEPGLLFLESPSTLNQSSAISQKKKCTRGHRRQTKQELALIKR